MSFGYLDSCKILKKWQQIYNQEEIQLYYYLVVQTICQKGVNVSISLSCILELHQQEVCRRCHFLVLITAKEHNSSRNAGHLLSSCFSLVSFFSPFYFFFVCFNRHFGVWHALRLPSGWENVRPYPAWFAATPKNNLIVFLIWLAACMCPRVNTIALHLFR